MPMKKNLVSLQTRQNWRLEQNMALIGYKVTSSILIVLVLQHQFIDFTRLSYHMSLSLFCET